MYLTAAGAPKIKGKGASQYYKTSCERVEWCRVCLFQTERDRRILCVCN